MVISDIRDTVPCVAVLVIINDQARMMCAKGELFCFGLVEALSDQLLFH